MDEAWAKWAGDINKKLARLDQRVAQLQDHFYGTKAELKEGKELAVSRLIRTVVWELLAERKISCATRGRGSPSSFMPRALPSPIKARCGRARSSARLPGRATTPAGG
jgi:hypothetical protein